MNVAVDCHMVASPHPGDAGNARYAVALTRALRSTGAPEDRVAALVTNAEASREIGPGVAPVLVPDSAPLRLTRDAGRALRSVRADAAVFSYVAPPRPVCPTLVAVHDPTFLTNPEWLGRRSRAILGTLGTRSARRARVVLALSDTAKTDICAALALDPARVHVVSPYAAPVFAPAGGAAERVLARWALDRYVVTVGDIGPRKNIAALAEAVGMLGDPSLELVVVGRAGVDADEILTSARARWLGPVTDAELADLYRAAAVTAHPARYEGFGLTVLEALACASPVVAAATGALPEVVGDAGVLVAPDPGSIAEGLRAALEPATAARLREAGPERAARYSRRAMGEAAWSAVRAATA